MIYWFIFIYLIFYAIWDFYNLEKALNYILLFVAYILIVFFRGLRWNTGTDWNSYYYHFLNPNNVDFEFGYELLVLIVRSFSSSYTLFLLIFNGLIILLLDRSLTLLKVRKGYFLLFYFTGSALFPVRQHLAAALIFYVFAMVANTSKSMHKMTSIVLASFSVHLTAILGSIFVFFRSNSKVLMFIFIICSLFLFFALFPEYFERIVMRYIFYSENEFHEVGFQTFSFIKALFFLFLYLFTAKLTIKKFWILWTSILYIFINYFISYFFGEFGRLASLFHLVYLLLLSESIYGLFVFIRDSIYLHVIVSFLCFTMLASDLYKNVYSNRYSDLLVPYIHIWSDVSRDKIY